MNKKGNLFVSVLLLFFIFLLLANNIYCQAFKRLKDGDKAFEIALRTLDDKKISTEDYKNKNILAVVFWKLSSERSISSLKYMQKIQEIYEKDFGLVVISVYCPREPVGIGSQELEEIKKIIKDNNISVPILLDEGLKTFSTYGIISLPSTMILNKESITQYILPGYPKFGAEQDINKNIKKILGIPEEIITKKKYEPKLAASRNYKLALAVLASGNKDKAIDYLLSTIQTDPEYPEPYALLGKLYSQSQKNDKAIENYRKSLELDSDNIEALISYGFLCMDAGMNEDALLIFNNLIEKSPEFAASGHFGKGSIYLKNEVFDSARIESEKAEKIYSESKKLEVFEKFNYARNTSNLAEIYINLENKNKAIESFKKAREKYEELLTEAIKDYKTND